LKKYFGLLAVFLVAALLYQMSFAKTMNKLNNQKKSSHIEQNEAYGVVRSFISLANKKEQLEIEKRITNRGLDLGFDILLNPPFFFDFSLIISRRSSVVFENKFDFFLLLLKLLSPQIYLKSSYYRDFNTIY